MCTVQFILFFIFTISLLNAGISQRENPIRDALFLGNTSINNNTLDDCIWRRGNDKDACPDPEVRVLLYTGNGPDDTETREVLDTTQADWLRNSHWNPNHDNVMLIHGYAGGEDTLPIVVLKDGISQRENPIRDALFLGNTSINNNTLDDCIWRRGNDKDACPDPEVRVLLYTGNGPDDTETREVLDTTQADWLRNSHWNPNHDNVMLIHGYAGGEDTLPIVVLKDAYVRNGTYNVFFVDWGVLSQPPCYPAAVHNMRPIARCVADAFTFLRASGLPVERTTCIGHSLGAHICGIMANYMLFRMHRIIGLDPARPLVRAGLSNRLDPGDAISVQVVHTNAGHYGEIGRVGHVDFCINGGKMQPYCENTPNDNLCSHVWVICYMAESISGNFDRSAEPCSRRCPTGPRPGHRLGIPIALGQHTPMTASGSYCVADKVPPYCPETKGAPGDKRCCLSIYNATNNIT